MTPTRSFVLLGTIAYLLGPVSMELPGLAEIQEQWASLSEVPGIQRQERKREEELDLYAATLRRRSAMKHEVVRQLLAGRFTLPEAASRIRGLDAELLGKVIACSPSYPGSSEGERRCRQLIAWIRLQCKDPSSGDLQTAVARLESELAGYLYCQGSVDLPEVVN
jgi:hypothetical protein